MNVDAEPISILVVEDNAADADLAVEILGSGEAPAAMSVINDGRSALAYLRTTASDGGALPDIVLLDLNLPRFSGLDTLEAIKADGSLRELPVVVLTTSKSAREIERAYRTGAAAVLTKPLRLAEYRDMLAAFRAFWMVHAHLKRDSR